MIVQALAVGGLAVGVVAACHGGAGFVLRSPNVGRVFR